ncbi:MAG TPA: hypothetical protein VIY86_13945 [Pirellulaceae bacterium]
MANTASEHGQHLRSIDRVCDEFESQWRSGTAPDLRVFLEQVSLELRAEALGELLALDLAYRRERGEDPVLDDYRREFGGLAHVLRREFDQFARKGGDSCSRVPGVDNGAKGNSAAEPILDIPGLRIIPTR